MNFSCRHGQNELLKFKSSIRIGKKNDLNDFECGKVCAMWAGLSVSETADPNNNHQGFKRMFKGKNPVSSQHSHIIQTSNQF